MRQKNLLILTLLLAVAFVLSSCATPAEADQPAEPQTEPAAVENNEQAATENTEPAAEEDTAEEAVLEEAYPPPVENIMVEDQADDAYPAPGRDDLPEFEVAEDQIYAMEDLSPTAEDADQVRGEAFIQTSEVFLMESDPVQAKLVLEGFLPDPCHSLRVVVTEADAQGQIQLEVYSVSDPDVMCITVLEPFEAHVSLGDFSTGEYSVLVNGEQLQSFKLP